MKIKSRQLFYISLVFLLTVIAWIAVEIYDIRKNQAFVVDYEKSSKIKIVPIQNTAIVDKLVNRK